MAKSKGNTNPTGGKSKMDGKKGPDQQRLGNTTASPIKPAPSTGPKTWEQYQREVYELNTRDYTNTLDYPTKGKMPTANGTVTPSETEQKIKGGNGK